MKVQINALCFMSLAASMWAQSPASPLDNVPLKNWDAPLHWLPPSAQEAVREKAIEAPALDAAGATQPLDFVAITPCRVMDTRAGSGFPGAFGPPSLPGSPPAAPRTVPIPTSACGIPSSAAYSLNFTLVCTYGPVGFVAAWPDPNNNPFPGTSITNAFSGGVVANAAVVPAGPDGGINVIVSSAGDVLIDINGYYVPGGSGAGPRSTGLPYQLAQPLPALTPAASSRRSQLPRRPLPLPRPVAGEPPTSFAQTAPGRHLPRVAADLPNGPRTGRISITTLATLASARRLQVKSWR